ncbi:hypothetical protein [Anabaena azotica]|uniref:hypothetical protein n=1 Tax=Anabaena azotica TaxID=197653 RepID=UPI001F559E7D|nr:hypothetical protein [Anabaena azotica]
MPKTDKIVINTAPLISIVAAVGDLEILIMPHKGDRSHTVPTSHPSSATTSPGQLRHFN